MPAEDMYAPGRSQTLLQDAAKISCYVLTALSQLSLTSHSELSLYMLMQASPSNGCADARASSFTCTAAVRDFYSTSAKAFSNSGLCRPGASM
jgi:uncharacterized protein YbbK (DUF523 family)